MARTIKVKKHTRMGEIDVKSHNREIESRKASTGSSMPLISNEKLDELIKDEAMATKEYKELGLDNLSRDEAKHKEFLENLKEWTEYKGFFIHRVGSSMFYIKKSKLTPKYYTYVTTMDEAKKYIDQLAQEKEDSKNPAKFVKVGDVFYDSWGYNATNYNFCKVLEVKGTRVKCIMLKKKFVRETSGGRQVMFTNETYGEPFYLRGDMWQGRFSLKGNYPYVESSRDFHKGNFSKVENLYKVFVETDD